MYLQYQVKWMLVFNWLFLYSKVQEGTFCFAWFLFLPVSGNKLEKSVHQNPGSKEISCSKI